MHLIHSNSKNRINFITKPTYCQFSMRNWLFVLFKLRLSSFLHFIPILHQSCSSNSWNIKNGQKRDTLQPCGITSILLSNALDMRLHPWEGKQQLTILHNELLHDTQRLLKSSLHSSCQKEDNSFRIATHHSLTNLYKGTL